MKKILTIILIFISINVSAQFKSDKEAKKYKETFDLIYAGNDKTKEAELYAYNGHYILYKTGKWVAVVDNIDWKNHPKIGVEIGDTIRILYKNKTWEKIKLK